MACARPRTPGAWAPPGTCPTETGWAQSSGYTPIYVRYNSGLHISENGRLLAALLDELTANWPVEVSEIALIGHSMGGLVARGACHYAPAGSWRERVRHVFTLGAPHRGAPLERGANALCHAASRLPETRPFAAPIKLRSAGVKDLGFGYIVDEDWDGHDPDAFLRHTGTVVPFLASATHYFVSASVSRRPDDPLGRLIGDLLVLRPSAWAHGGHGERLQFPVHQYRHVGGATHFDLLNHPAVYGQIAGWLTSGHELPAPAATGRHRPPPVVRSIGPSARSARGRARGARAARCAGAATGRRAPRRSRRR
ncbi:MAG TPA: hypothetical protein VIK04_08605 [Solirubrobacteraceae bacterium]